MPSTRIVMKSKAAPSSRKAAMKAAQGGSKKEGTGTAMKKAVKETPMKAAVMKSAPAMKTGPMKSSRKEELKKDEKKITPPMKVGGRRVRFAKASVAGTDETGNIDPSIGRKLPAKVKTDGKGGVKSAAANTQHDSTGGKATVGSGGGGGGDSSSSSSSDDEEEDDPSDDEEVSTKDEHMPPVDPDFEIFGEGGDEGVDDMLTEEERTAKIDKMGSLLERATDDDFKLATAEEAQQFKQNAMAHTPQILGPVGKLSAMTAPMESAIVISEDRKALELERPEYGILGFPRYKYAHAGIQKDLLPEAEDAMTLFGNGTSMEAIRLSQIERAVIVMAAYSSGLFTDIDNHDKEKPVNPMKVMTTSMAMELADAGLLTLPVVKEVIAECKDMFTLSCELSEIDTDMLVENAERKLTDKINCEPVDLQTVMSIAIEFMRLVFHKQADSNFMSLDTGITGISVKFTKAIKTETQNAYDKMYPCGPNDDERRTYLYKAAWAATGHPGNRELREVALRLARVGVFERAIREKRIEVAQKLADEGLEGLRGFRSDRLEAQVEAYRDSEEYWKDVRTRAQAELREASIDIIPSTQLPDDYDTQSGPEQTATDAEIEAAKARLDAALDFEKIWEPELLEEKRKHITAMLREVVGKRLRVARETITLMARWDYAETWKAENYVIGLCKQKEVARGYKGIINELRSGLVQAKVLANALHDEARTKAYESGWDYMNGKWYTLNKETGEWDEHVEGDHEKDQDGE